MKIVTSIAALMIGLTVFGEVLVKSVDPGATVEIDSPIVADDGVRFVNSLEFSTKPKHTACANSTSRSLFPLHNIMQSSLLHKETL